MRRNMLPGCLYSAPTCSVTHPKGSNDKCCLPCLGPNDLITDAHCQHVNTTQRIPFCGRYPANGRSLRMKENIDSLSSNRFYLPVARFSSLTILPGHLLRTYSLEPPVVWPYPSHFGLKTNYSRDQRWHIMSRNTSTILGLTPGSL